MLSRLMLSAALVLVACDKGQTARQPEPSPTAEPSPSPTAKPEPTADAKPKADKGPSEINKRFLDPNLDVKTWVSRFEGHSREVSKYKAAIVKAMGLQPGQAIADVGAGTGLFMPLFAKGVGGKGSVYAVDISPRFLDHLRKRAKKEGLTNVKVVKGTATSVELPKRSVNVAFVCDTYHHFEQPAQTLASIHRALRPGGALVIVDFAKIPGKTRPWIMKHVRADEATVRKEVEAARFRFAGSLGVTQLKDNYAIKFVKITTSR